MLFGPFSLSPPVRISELRAGDLVAVASSDLFASTSTSAIGAEASAAAAAAYAPVRCVVQVARDTVGGASLVQLSSSGSGSSGGSSGPCLSANHPLWLNGAWTRPAALVAAGKGDAVKRDSSQRSFRLNPVFIFFFIFSSVFAVVGSL